jgi:hypothetical protein
MKICVLGLDCATPDVIFRDERLVNIRHIGSCSNQRTVPIPEAIYKRILKVAAAVKP